MYLKNIKVVGFKSFVDATVIPVRGHMNAIVGPNGCGKSNIVDAVRWVIGEISAKQLRGQSMSDVIFNGTSERKPVAKASVELCFDNSAGKLIGQYAAYSEIVIRREVEREAQSNYYLNGTRCRRRDILDIFYGTGLGARSYSIVEQGMISQFIEAKPEDLRQFIEEVAGIAKYKERRRETENRMAHTKDNLDRLNDLLEELTKQQRHLKRQASAAERYKAYKEQERVLNAEIKALQWQKIHHDLLDQDKILSEQEVSQASHLAGLRHIESEIEKLRQDQITASDHQSQIQKKYYELGAEIARIEQRIQYKQAETERCQVELNETESLWQELSDSIFEHEEAVSEIENELENLSPQIEVSLKRADDAHNDYQQSELRIQQWQEVWDKFQKVSNETDSHAEVLQTRLTHCQKNLETNQIRGTELQNQLSDLNTQSLQDEIDHLTEQSESEHREFSSLQNKIQQHGESIAAQRQNNDESVKLLDQAQLQLQQLQGRYASLNALQQAALGADDNNINLWLSSQHIETVDRLGQQLTVEAGWETALETICSGYLDAVCVDHLGRHIEAADGEFTKGKLTLVEKASIQDQKTNSKYVTLASKVQSNWPLLNWLYGIYVADSLDEAKQIRCELNDYESVITRDGIWLGKHWIHINKQNNPEDGILLRRQALTTLRQDIADKQRHVNTLETACKQGKEALILLEKARDGLQQDHHQRSIALSKVQSNLSAKCTHFEDCERRIEQINVELKRCHQSIDTLKIQQSEFNNQYQKIIDEKQRIQAKHAQLVSERTENQALLKEKRDHAQSSSQAADQLQVRLTTNQNQNDLLKQTLRRDTRQLEQLDERRALLKKNIDASGQPLVDLNDQLQTQLDNRLSVEQKLQTAKTVLNQHTHQLKQFENQRREIADILSSMQEKLEKMRVGRQTLIVKQSTIKEQLQEMSFDLDQVLATLSNDVDMVHWQESLQKIQNRMSRLGPINLAAIDEYETVSERKTYLDKQHQDLTEAIDVLNNAIRKIDRETKTRFQETFDKVNNTFQELFPRIFGGGRGYLELLDQDLLSTGIGVKAQPPGKRNTSIQMLSGGEKALTAIALVFSIFKLNPAPFCILDEVDAPLDDLNVGRFCQLVKEMADETQFLIISHNKVTIEMADYLMGITMNEPGVSRLVSVDMREAMDMMAIA